MKNLILLIFFSFLSLFLLVILITFAFLPKLCFCFHSFFNKNYKTIKKQNTRVRRIKRARLRLLYKSQVNHEKPMQKELDRSKGVFFDEELQQKIKDEASLAYVKTGKIQQISLNALFIKKGKFYASTLMNKHRNSLFILGKKRSENKDEGRDENSSECSNYLNFIVSSLLVNSRFYLTQFRNFLMSSVTKYFNH